jgi:hypothetical protein
MVGLNVSDSPVKRSVENRRLRENVAGIDTGMRSDVLRSVEVHGAGTIREMRWMVLGWCGFNLVEGQRERRGCSDGETLGDSGRCRTAGHGFGTALMSGTICTMDCRRQKLEETTASQRRRH